jgi:fatty-acyl-CoA synthase
MAYTIRRQPIGQALAEVAARHAGRPALVATETGATFSHADLLRATESAARGFLGLGIAPGDRVALWAPNVPEWLLAFFGLARIGAVAVPIDPGAPPSTANFILSQSECRAVVTLAEEDGRLRDAARRASAEIPGLERVVTIGGPETGAPDGELSWERMLAGGREVPERTLAARSAGVRPEDPTAIMYTSGTTGLPKGVVLNHLGLVNKSLCATERQGIAAADRLCLFFPLFHMFGNTCIALAGLLRGACLVMAGRRFDPPAVLSSIAAERCTAVYGSPSMLIALLDHPRFRPEHWATVKKGIVGGAPCPMELMRRLVREIGVAGITVAWGITEASSWITMTHPQDPIERRVATIGRPLPCCEVKIVDPASGAELPPGRTGELCTRGLVMTEYFKLPAATAAAVDRDGWLHTGDLGEMDAEGYVRITGRLKEVIVRGGATIFPVEIEEVIYRLPEVSEVQVFGFPHPELGMEAAAWIRLKAGCRLPLAAVAAHVARSLPAEQRPRHYKFVDSFPATASGKIQKFKLAELALAEYGRPPEPPG